MVSRQPIVPSRASILTAVGFAVLALTYGVSVTPIGFNPTDDGFVLSQSWRLLEGQIPHTSFVSPRPIGSAILHSITFALPFPLLLTSRWLVLIEIVATAAVHVEILKRCVAVAPSRQLTIVLVTATAIVNVHTFPLMAWHTIDGLFLSAVGTFIVLRAAGCRSSRGVVVGSLVTGLALVVKQSFLPTAAMIPILAGTTSPTSWRFRATLSTLPVLLPTLSYLAWCHLNGGVLEQLRPQQSPPKLPLALTVAATTFLLLGPVFATLIARWSERKLAHVPKALRRERHYLTAIQTVILLATIVTLINSRLSIYGWWPWTLTGLSLLSLIVSIAHRGLHMMPALAIAISAIAASLSLGYAKPSLVAGSLATLTFLNTRDLWMTSRMPFRVWLGHSLPRGLAVARVRRSLAIVACGLLLTCSFAAREQLVYRDLPASDQGAALGALTPKLKGIRSNANVAELLWQVGDCLARFPAQRLAVVPDGAAIPLLFGRSNPLPVDWWYPPEIVDRRERVLLEVQTSTDLNLGHLVLFQTFGMDSVATVPLTHATLNDELFDYEGGYANDLFRTIPGETVTCGPFVAKYKNAG